MLSQIFWILSHRLIVLLAPFPPTSTLENKLSLSKLLISNFPFLKLIWGTLSALHLPFHCEEYLLKDIKFLFNWSAKSCRVYFCHSLNCNFCLTFCNVFPDIILSSTNFCLKSFNFWAIIVAGVISAFLSCKEFLTILVISSHSAVVLVQTDVLALPLGVQINFQGSHHKLTIQSNTPHTAAFMAAVVRYFSALDNSLL